MDISEEMYQINDSGVMMKDSFSHPYNKNQHMDSETSLDLRDTNGVNNAIGSNDLKESWSNKFVNF